MAKIICKPTETAVQSVHHIGAQRSLGCLLRLS